VALYARQLAWLQCRPKKPGKPSEDDEPQPTRFEQITGRGETPELPPVEAQQIIHWLHELGWCMPSGMGIGPLTSTEIESWSRLSQTPLDPWEFAAIRTGSSAYAGQTSNDTPQAPWSPEGEQQQHKPKVAGAFKALAKKVNGK
jgi:hypothetical protein